ERFQSEPLSQVIDKIAERLFDSDRDEPHRILATLPLSHYVTTNADGFLASALRWKKRNPVVEHCRWREDLESLPTAYRALTGTLQAPLVFHLYGNDSDPTSLVL